MAKRYDKGGQRVTDCCGCYSTYCGEDLVCRSCYHPVTIGEGDGCEFRPGTNVGEYYKKAFAEDSK